MNSATCRLLLLLQIAACCGGCSGGKTSQNASPDGSGEERYTIVTTTAMIADIAAEVAGDHADVVSLMGTGVDPHLYRPTTSDTTKLIGADVIFYTGLLLEGGMEEALERAGENGKPVYAVSDGIEETDLIVSEAFDGHPDPHVWGDVSLWSDCVEFIAEKLSEYDPAHAEEYRANAERYRGELAELDAYVREVIGGIPEQKRYLVTAHDAFSYFSRAYGIPVRSVLGITTESEAGVDDVNRLVDFLVENQVPAVFVESSVNKRNLEAVIAGAEDREWTVKRGGTLYSDAMGAPGTYEGTYIGMIDHNATMIARALGGDVPETGFRGKLRLASGKVE
ncbi:MAG: manganese transporter [Planctomycetota bacterium]|nr:MAG: manganese transporter [Planctomycetota bacterium]REJ85959.1 MAG: manganese transporter [Planctomycetota bacterium]REK28501.1 MAG: manganese transporter [Planctomycetota bacterium]REK29079.1 MAG: manganese transporter [Planctomycetota bacterium]